MQKLVTFMLVVMLILSYHCLIVFLFMLQPHVVCGEQLTHSAYLQCLAALAVDLHLDTVLCYQPQPLGTTTGNVHLLSEVGLLQWMRLIGRCLREQASQ